MHIASVEDVCLYVMTGMLDVIQNDKTRSVEDDANGRKVSERDLDNEVVDESILFHVTNTKQEKSRGRGRKQNWGCKAYICNVSY